MSMIFREYVASIEHHTKSGPNPTTDQKIGVKLFTGTLTGMSKRHVGTTYKYVIKNYNDLLGSYCYIDLLGSYFEYFCCTSCSNNSIS